ncbi:hypothetical protein CTTA_5049 [Comamonas testosteroni]|uniref:DUF4410 domain-containing protein n=1 Tax=Comamonas testosteroni TaxID=285 RepID=A0A5A7MMP3_COMTE|nr:hypothetical protein [Comamonas testosteroni]GEQ78044.1 hypothetical protein CTTA_5049 [Comamonas testosteroni]
MKKLAISMLVAVALTGCASSPSRPVEEPLSLKLNGTAVEVQQSIEEYMLRRGLGYKVESATDRSIVFKTACSNIPQVAGFKCGLIMMAVGNSRWDGPYAVVTFRTADIRGVVTVSGSAEWCATNAFGKTNCMPNGAAADMNDLLRSIDSNYKATAVTSR